MDELARPGPDTIYYGMIDAVEQARATEPSGDFILTAGEFAGAKQVIWARLSTGEQRIVDAVAQGFRAGPQRDTFMLTFSEHLYYKTWG